MTAREKGWFWGAVLLGAFALIYLLRDVLGPFVAGAAVAYLLDPTCDKLEEKGLSRALATTLVTVVFFLVALAVLGLAAPLLLSQIFDLLQRIPDIVAGIEAKLAPLLEIVRARIDGGELDVAGSLGAVGGDLAQWIGRIVGGVASGFGAAFGVLSFLLITPVVAFYLLRDWDRMIATIDSYLPLAYRETIRAQAREVDRTLSGFVRGQATVCLLLGLFYGIGLMLVGLDFGFVIGLMTGFVSFIPYVGMLLGVVLGMGVAIAQFDSVLPIALVAAVFAVGQVLEGNFVTPNLVGDKVGLHALWIIFALLAGGALFGFVGVLLAVPVAAVIGVLVRFFLGQYRDSRYYRFGAEPAADPEGRGEGGDGSAS